MTPPIVPQLEVAPASLPPLPVRAGTADERRSMELVQKWAGGAARLEGCVGDAPPGALELAHLGAAALATVTHWFAPWALVGVLVVLAVSATARAAGWGGIEALVPRRAAWNLRIGQAGPSTRYVVAVAADRTRPLGGVRELVAVVITLVTLLAAAAPWLPDLAHPAPGLVLLGVAFAFTWRRIHADVPGADFPEARAVAAALQSMGRAGTLARTDVAGVVAGTGADTGAGVRGFLDWWALDRARCTVLWVDGGASGVRLRGGPVDRLRKEGWEVVVIPVPAGDRDGMGVDRAWLVG